MRRAITLVTDFGTRDGYVGEMKGVLLEGAPDARLVDVTHDVPPGDVRAGGWVLGRIWPRFPLGSVHLAVVDPGVGSGRRAVAARIRDRWLVAPDNGLVTLAERGGAGTVPAGTAGGRGADEDAGPASDDAAGTGGGVEAAREIDPDRVGLEPLSDTFHGRDLFAPAAARLAAGGDPGELGPALDPGGLVRLELEKPRRAGDEARGAVVHVDRFGNLVTNVPTGWLPATPVAEVGDHRVQGLGDGRVPGYIG
jgi:S-adenosylmethionine hydrolase